MRLIGVSVGRRSQIRNHCSRLSHLFLCCCIPWLDCLLWIRPPTPAQLLIFFLAPNMSSVAIRGIVTVFHSNSTMFYGYAVELHDVRVDQSTVAANILLLFKSKWLWVAMTLSRTRLNISEKWVHSATLLIDKSIYTLAWLLCSAFIYL